MAAFKRTVPFGLVSVVVWLFWGPSVAVQAADRLSLRFAFQDRVGSVISILAVEKGFFKAHQRDITPLRFSSGPACAEALYSGAADIGGMGDTTAIIMVTRSADMVILASHATGEHRHRIMVRQDSPIRTLADLKGHRLGVKKGTSTFGGLLAALDKANIDLEETQIMDLTPPTMTDALFAGSLAAEGSQILQADVMQYWAVVRTPAWRRR